MNDFQDSIPNSFIIKNPLKEIEIFKNYPTNYAVNQNGKEFDFKQISRNYDQNLIYLTNRLSNFEHNKPNLNVSQIINQRIKLSNQNTVRQKLNHILKTGQIAYFSILK